MTAKSAIETFLRFARKRRQPVEMGGPTHVAVPTEAAVETGQRVDLADTAAQFIAFTFADEATAARADRIVFFDTIESETTRLESREFTAHARRVLRSGGIAWEEAESTRERKRSPIEPLGERPETDERFDPPSKRRKVGHLPRVAEVTILKSERAELMDILDADDGRVGDLWSTELDIHDNMIIELKVCRREAGEKPYTDLRLFEPKTNHLKDLEFGTEGHVFGDFDFTEHGFVFRFVDCGPPSFSPAP